MKQLIILLILYFTLISRIDCQGQISKKAYEKYVLTVNNLILQNTLISQDVTELLNKFVCSYEQFDQNCKKLINFSKEGNFFEIIKLLKNDPVDIDACDKYGWTALMYACWNEYKEIVEFLIKNGANVNIQNNAGCTALMYAAHKGNEDIVKLLIINSANVDIQNFHKKTALSYSEQENYKQISTLLKIFSKKYYKI